MDNLASLIMLSLALTIGVIGFMNFLFCDVRGAMEDWLELERERLAAQKRIAASLEHIAMLQQAEEAVQQPSFDETV